MIMVGMNVGTRRVGAAGMRGVMLALGAAMVVTGGQVARADSVVAAWGWDGYGQCDVPTRLGVVKHIAAGGNHTVAVHADGSVTAWGQNNWGQCNVPAELGAVAHIDAGGLHTVVVKTDGSVAAWGYNG